MIPYISMTLVAQMPYQRPLIACIHYVGTSTSIGHVFVVDIDITFDTNDVGHWRSL